MRDVRAEETATVSVEYAILLALIVASAVFAWQGLGATTEDFVSHASGGIGNLGD